MTAPLTDRELASRARNLLAAGAAGRAIQSQARADRIAELARFPQNTTTDAYAPNGQTAQQAAWYFGWSTRTITRYRKALREAS